MATRLSKTTETKLEVVRKTAESMAESSFTPAVERTYWRGYLRATEQALRILRGEE